MVDVDFFGYSFRPKTLNLMFNTLVKLLLSILSGSLRTKTRRRIAKRVSNQIFLFENCQFLILMFVQLQKTSTVNMPPMTKIWTEKTTTKLWSRECNGSTPASFTKPNSLFIFVNFVKRKFRCIVDHKTTNLLFFNRLKLLNYFLCC